MNRQNKQELAVVTGASGGIGLASAKELARRGFHVLAGFRSDADREALWSERIEPVKLDITKSEDVTALAERVAMDPRNRPLRALVNNAGVGANAPVELFGLDAWRSVFEVNYFGQIAMTQALLPALIQHKGRVVNISSVGGRIAMATYGPYGGTKFALEALSDSLRREMRPLGVEVVVIEPGAIQTKISGRAISTAADVVSKMTPVQKQRYGALMHAVMEQAAEADRKGLSAERAGRVVADAVTARKPRTRYGVGREAALIGFLRLLPDRLVDSILAAALRPYRAA